MKIFYHGSILLKGRENILMVFQVRVGPKGCTIILLNSVSTSHCLINLADFIFHIIPYLLYIISYTYFLPSKFFYVLPICLLVLRVKEPYGPMNLPTETYCFL